MAVQRTFNVSHLRDYLSSAEGIHKMFEQLGYETYDPESLDAQDDLDMSETDAKSVQAVYLINSMDFGHTIWLFEVDDTTSVRLRGIAYDLLQRAGTHTIVVTKDYKDVIFVHPYSVGNLTKSNIRVNKLKVDVKNPTRHDVDTINALLARGREPAEIYKAQDDAFNVTKVTNKFYKEYRAYFERVQQTVVEWNKGIPEFQNSDQRDKLHVFVQRLMGRLMFLYFLQRKGWLGGDSNFLTTQYKQMVKRHAGELGDKTTYFYREVLEPLFFETLNKKRDENWTQWGVEIPYLNGGLFDRSRDPNGMILLPDTLFDPNSNEGILAFFNRYNFTIADDTPLEQDVAVDPEMLGKVFENMLEEEDRGQSGSFYTPRTIVSYMCQEALAGYLEESAYIPRGETRQHFDPDALIHLTKVQADRADEALKTLTVLDPAVGSGSFLVGMMNEIITLRRKIAAARSEQVTPAVIAGWKEGIIRDTLYGVDIKPGAIEIAQLRLWLALIVNQTMDDARPLPNLDYKLMAGNSLIETINGEPILSESAQVMLNSAAKPLQPGLFESATDKEARKLEDLRRDYFTASPTERAQLAQDIKLNERKVIEAGLNDLLEPVQQKIHALEKKQKAAGGKWGDRDAKQYTDLLKQEQYLQNLKRDLWDDEASLPFFLYRLHFNDVFAAKGGFDVVVANPPYVRQELIRDQKPELQASYKDVYAGTADLFVYFFARSVELLTRKGQLSFITPNKFMRANYGKKLRNYLSHNTTLLTLIDFDDLPIFDATTYPMITIARNEKPTDNGISILEVNSLMESEQLNVAADRAFHLPQNELSDNGWQLSSPELRSLMDRITSSAQTLAEYVNNAIHYGIKTGLNAAFIIDTNVRDLLISEDAKSIDLIRPYLRGRDVKRWNVQDSKLYMIAIQNSDDVDANNEWGDASSETEALRIFQQRYPAISNHMLKYEKKLKKRSDQGRFWWELRACAYYSAFQQPKIIFPSIVGETTFALDREKHYSNDKTTIIATDDLFTLGILNASIQNFFFSQVASTRRGGYFEQKPMYVEQIPIPNAPDDLRQQIAILAQQCLDAAQDTPDKLPALEAQLNQLVYQAYGLDEEDIRVIEKHLGE